MTPGSVSKAFDLDSWLQHWARERPNEIAFVSEGIESTFADINIDARRVAELLSQIGISQGDLVAVALPSYLSWVFSFALQLIGVTVVSKSVETQFPAYLEVRWHIGLTPDTFLSPERNLIVTDALITSIQRTQPIKNAPGFRSTSDPVILFSTSGTTGSKKYLAHSSVTLQDLVEQPWPMETDGQGEFAVLFQYGSYVTTTLALKRLTSGRLLVNPTKMNFETLKMFKRHNVGSISASPGQAMDLLQTVRCNPELNFELKLLVLSGSAPTPTLLQGFTETFRSQIIDAYGSTEVGSVARTDQSSTLNRGATIDQGVELQVVDEFDNVLPHGKVGKIRYRRPGMVLGYYRDPIIARDIFHEGFFYPGDLGWIDSQSKLHLSGRSTEIINLNGVKIRPEDVDDYIMAFEGVSDCASFAISDESGLDQLAIGIVKGASFQSDLFEKYMQTQPSWRVHQLFELETVPRNANGKILRSMLSEQYSL